MFRKVKKLTVLKIIAIVAPVFVVWVLEELRQSFITKPFPIGIGNLAIAGILLVVSFFVITYIFSLIEKSQEESIRQNKELSALNSVALAVSESLDLGTILQRAIEQIISVTGADACDIWLPEDESQDIVRQAYSGDFTGGLSGKSGYLSNHRVYNMVARSGRTMVVPDIAASEYFPQNRGKESRYRSLVSVPMLSKNNVIGVLNIFGVKPDQFSRESIGILASMANYIALAVENANLYDKVMDTATAEERERIAREMHDGLAQVLSYVNAKSQAARQYISKGKPEEASGQLESLEKVANELYDDIRETILNLRTGISSQKALSDVVKEYLARFSQMSGIETSLENEAGEDVPLPADVEMQIIRIIQEALANVRKHAGSDRAFVRLSLKGNRYNVIIEDSGQGFDASVPRKRSTPHFGFQIMKERAESIDGTLDIESSPGAGTKITLSIPVAEEVR